MKNLTLPLVLALAAPVSAQEAILDTPDNPFAPAKQMRAYTQLVGDWTGGGTMRMAPGDEPTMWTATARYEPVLNGHAMQESMTVTVEGWGEMQFTGWYAYSAETDTHHGMGLSSMGPGNWSEIHWVDERTMMMAAVTQEEGKVHADRTLYILGDDSFSVKMFRATGAAPEFTHVSGDFKRTANPDAEPVEAGTQAVEEPTGKLEKLGGLVGTWSMTGSIVPMPGMPKMAMTGTETISVAAGGTGLLHHIQGSAAGGPAYEAWAGSYWDPVEESYRLVMVDNMGGVDSSLGRFVDPNTMVYASAGTMMGTPNLVRTTMTMKDGDISAVSSLAMFGKAEPIEVFRASYERVE